MTKKILFRKAWSRAFTYTYYTPDKNGMCKCIEMRSTDKTIVNVSKIPIADIVENVKYLVGEIIEFKGILSCSIYMCPEFDMIVSGWINYVGKRLNQAQINGGN